jgi:hypothetical protein
MDTQPTAWRLFAHKARKVCRCTDSRAFPTTIIEVVLRYFAALAAASRVMAREMPSRSVKISPEASSLIAQYARACHHNRA